ncbi:MAG: GIY-YIG nuclease family protein [Defluviitaleaceae bacterium]|nr:GIY-YIG nuclease family protein [Defluviitaleaceae bacterium]
MSKLHNTEHLANIIREFPLTPGCYLFKDAEGRVLYVGKSKALRKRVASYLRQQKEEKIAMMMRFAADVSYQCTDTDIEAILLEHRLIKMHRPPYNARMKKDRRHWYIKIDIHQPYPGMFVIPKDTQQTEFCIGPFYRQENAIEALDIIGEYWKTPTCGFRNANTTKSPCLRFHIQRCLGPCAKCSPINEYKSAVDEVISFFSGSFEPTLQKIKKLVYEASQAMAYEKAAHFNNQYNSLYALATQLSNAPPKLNGKSYCVLLKSRHEENFLLLYLQDQCVPAWMRFASQDEWEIKSNAMVQYIKKGEIPKGLLAGDFVVFKKDDGLRLANAVWEVEALRRYVDVLNIELLIEILNF